MMDNLIIEQLVASRKDTVSTCCKMCLPNKYVDAGVPLQGMRGAANKNIVLINETGHDAVAGLLR